MWIWSCAKRSGVSENPDSFLENMSVFDQLYKETWAWISEVSWSSIFASRSQKSQRYDVKCTCWDYNRISIIWGSPYCRNESIGALPCRSGRWHIFHSKERDIPYNFHFDVQCVKKSKSGWLIRVYVYQWHSQILKFHPLLCDLVWCTSRRS